MTFETVLYELKDGVATVTMNRPDALNALSLQLTLDLAAAIRQAVADGARAVILTGNGRAFCSGGDLFTDRSRQKESSAAVWRQPDTDKSLAKHSVITCKNNVTRQRKIGPGTGTHAINGRNKWYRRLANEQNYVV